MRAARSHFETPGAVLGIFLTNKCNFVCAHCCTESGPRIGNHLSPTKLREYLDSLRDHSIEVLHLSGGEPFMHLGAVSVIVDFARERQFRIAINTNGFWSRSDRLKKLIATNNDVISDLHISFSVWHNEYVDADAVREAIEFSLLNVAFTELMIVHADEGIQPIINQLMPNGAPIGLHLSSSKVEALGRAKFLDSSIFYAGESEGGCLLVNRPTLLEDGSLILCCNTINYTTGAKGLVLGDAQTESLGDRLDLHRTDSLVTGLREVGPKKLVELFSLVPTDTQPKSSLDKCGYCSKLTQSKATAEKLREALGSSSWKAALKALQHSRSTSSQTT